MKKICFLLLFVFSSSFGFAQGSSDKLFLAYTGCGKIALAFWGFSQKNSYGNFTGVLFSLSGFRDIFLSVRKEVK